MAAPRASPVKAVVDTGVFGTIGVATSFGGVADCVGATVGCAHVVHGGFTLPVVVTPVCVLYDCGVGVAHHRVFGSTAIFRVVNCN